MGLSGYGARRTVYLGFSSYYHSMILPLERVVDTQDSVEINEITWSTYKASVRILRLPLRGIVESRNPPTPAITWGQ